MTDIMKLADIYADRLHIDRKYHNEESSYDRDAARAALQSAIETLQTKLEAANQLAQLNAEIGIRLKDDREVLAAKLVPLTEFAEEFLEAWEEGMANDSYLLRMVQSTFKPDAAKGGQHDI